MQLPADFVAQINAELRVGSLEETLTVTGDAPLVDVQSTARSQVLSRDVLDAIPTGRSFQSVGQLVVGVQLSRPDVGGSQAMQQTYFSVHGMTSRNTTVQVDGMMMNSTRGDNQVNPYFNDAMSQEISYETTGAGADVSAGGVRINMIPREGGNRFSGALFSAWSDGAWQADNLTQHLKDEGLSAVGKIDKIYDFNFSIGGPVHVRTSCGSSRRRASGVSTPRSRTCSTRRQGKCRIRWPTRSARRDDPACEQGLDDQQITSAHAASDVADELEEQAWACTTTACTRAAATTCWRALIPATASFIWRSPVYYTTQIKWTSTLSSKLLLEAGYGSNVNVTVQSLQDGVEQPRGTAAWYAARGPARSRSGDVVGVPEQHSDVRADQVLPDERALLCDRIAQHQGRRSVSGRAGSRRGRTRWPTSSRITARVVPDSVVIRNTPFRYRDTMNRDLGPVPAGLLDVQAADA